MDRIPKAANQNKKSKELLQKLVFGAVDRIPKAANQYKMCLSDPTTAPKSKELFQKLILGAVDGIPKAANDRSYHNPDKQRIAPKAHFRGCGRLPKAANQYQMCLSDPTTAPKSNELLQKLLFGAVDGIPKAANDRSYHSPEKQRIASVVHCFETCLKWFSIQIQAKISSQDGPQEPQEL